MVSYVTTSRIFSTNEDIENLLIFCNFIDFHWNILLHFDNERGPDLLASLYQAIDGLEQLRDDQYLVVNKTTEKKVTEESIDTLKKLRNKVRAPLNVYLAPLKITRLILGKLAAAKIAAKQMGKEDIIEVSTRLLGYFDYVVNPQHLPSLDAISNLSQEVLSRSVLPTDHTLFLTCLVWQTKAVEAFDPQNFDVGVKELEDLLDQSDKDCKSIVDNRKNYLYLGEIETRIFDRNMLETRFPFFCKTIKEKEVKNNAEKQADDILLKVCLSILKIAGGGLAVSTLSPLSVGVGTQIIGSGVDDICQMLLDSKSISIDELPKVKEALIAFKSKTSDPEDGLKKLLDMCNRNTDGGKEFLDNVEKARKIFLDELREVVSHRKPDQPPAPSLTSNT